MSVAAVRNMLREKAVMVSRAFKELFLTPDRRRRVWYRRVFFADDGKTIRTVGEYVLLDLRDYCFATKSTFDPDALIMARRAGRRDVWLRISAYLNLDEDQVQKLMEIDDGIR